MKCARQSRYWRSYRDSKTFTLTIYICEARLGFANGSSGNPLSSSFHGSSFHGASFSNLNLHGGSLETSLSGSSSSGGGHGPWDTKIVVSLPKDPMGERHETSRAGKTPNPVWDQAVVFKDIDYSELVRVEMRGIRKLGDNPVLASVEFEVHDVMGLSLRDAPSAFQLECDRSRARYGVILLAFRFDPPVAADVLGEFDGIGSATVPRQIPAVADQGEEDSITPAWGRPELSQQPEVEPVYINVDGHFACLLLDDDTSAHLCKQPHSARPSTCSSSSVSFGPMSCSVAAAARDRDVSPGRSRASIRRGIPHSHPHPHPHLQHPRLSVGSNNSAKSENSIFDPEALIHGRGSAVRMAASAEALSARDGGGDKRRSSVGKDSRARRPKSLGSSLAHQLSALGLGVSGGAGDGPKATSRSGASGANKKRGKPAPVELRRGSSSDDASRLETPQHRWSLPRRRLKHHEHHAASAAGGGGVAGSTATAGADYRGGGKRVRSRGGFSRAGAFPILNTLRARATGGPTRARSKSATLVATPDLVDSGDSSCASTVRAGEEALMYEPAPLAEPSRGAAHPHPHPHPHPDPLASAVCDVPVSLELSPTSFKAPPMLNTSRSLSGELTSSAKE